MAHSWQAVGDEEDISLPDQDALGVLTSTHVVAQRAEHAWINQECIGAVVELLRASEQQSVTGASNGGAASASNWYQQYHFFDGTERTVNWMLLLDALNFCFWAERDEPRWGIDYQGTRLNGYWAEAASLTRAIEEGYPLWDARYLSEISHADLAHIFRPALRENGQPTPDIPLFEQRLANTREVGRVLLERYEGQFSHAIEATGYSAVRLALLLAEQFPSFSDSATYRGRTVHFLKRAQICASDLHSAFHGNAWGALTDMEQLTIFADYKLPQILRHYGVLQYDPRLARRIDALELLAPGGEEEIEIRAVTIWACELIRRALAADGQRVMTAAKIDQRLWMLSQELTNMRPYHRVRTIYY